MKVLSIGNDQKILDPNSVVAKRMIRFGNNLEKLIIINFDSQGRKIKLSNQVMVYGCGSGSKFFYIFKAYKLAKKLIKEFGPNVVTTQDPFETGYIGLKIKKKFKDIGFHTQFHGDFLSSKFWQKSLKNKIRMRMLEKVLPQADSIRVVSNRIKESLIEYGVTEDIITIAPIYTQQVQKQVITKIDTRLELLTVARLESEKNLANLIKVFSEVLKEVPELKLTIVGDGSQRQDLEDLSEQLRISESVIFIGWQEDLTKFYNQADIFIAPSISEGYNRTVVEAMSVGLPVIMSNVGLAGEIVKNEVNGLVLPVNNQLNLQAAILRLVKDEKLRFKLGQSAEETVKKLPTEQELFNKQILSFKIAIDEAKK